MKCWVLESVPYAGHQIEKKEDNLYHKDVFTENSCNEFFDNIDIPINENAEGALENLDFEKDLKIS